MLCPLSNEQLFEKFLVKLSANVFFPVTEASSQVTTEVEEPKPRPFLRAQKRRSERAAHAATTKKQRDSSPTGPI